MTALFLVTVVVGVLAVASTLVVFTLMRKSDDDSPPFHLVGQAAGLLAAGVGGLVMTLSDTGTVGFSIAAVVSWAVLLGIIYRLLLPYLRRRWPSSADDHTG